MKVKVDLPQYPEGAEVVITGLGALKNGEENEVTPEQVQKFEARRGVPLREALTKAKGISIVKTTPKKKVGDK